MYNYSLQTLYFLMISKFEKKLLSTIFNVMDKSH